MAQQFHTLICLNIIFLPLIDSNYWCGFTTITLLNYRIKITPCSHCWEVVSHHLHSLPQYHQSHLHLACLFTSHLCHLPHILPQLPLSGIMFLLMQFLMILKCIPYITWHELLEDPEQFLVRLLSIDRYLISVTEPFPCFYWIKLTLKLLKQLLHEVCPQWAELVICDW